MRGATDGPGSDAGEGRPVGDAFDDVFGSAISKAVRRAVDGVGRDPAGSLDVTTEAPDAASGDTPGTDPRTDAGPVPFPVGDVADPYELLGVSRRATWGEISDAYKRRARAWHPDGADPSEQHRRQQLIRDLNAAYADLRIRRAR